MTLWPTFLAGTNFVMHSAGWLESGLVSCYEKFIVDVELLRMLYHVFEPLADQRGDAGLRRAPGGRPGRSLPRRGAHARAVPRVLLPAAALVDRELRALVAERWQDAAARATDIWQKTLEEYEEPELDARLEGRAEGVRRPPQDRAWRLTRQMFVAGAWTGAREGETFTADVARDRRGDRRGPAGRARGCAARDRGGERRVLAWSRTTAFERAACMHRVARRGREAPRRARAHADARPGQAAAAEAYGRGRGADRVLAQRGRGRQAARGPARRTPSRPGKRVLLVRRPRGVIGVITPWNWPYTMPAELIAPALACGNTVVWTPASTTAVAAIALAECVAEADLPPGRLQPGHRARLDGRRRDRPQPGDARRRLHRLDRDRAEGRRGRRGQGGRARARRQRAAGRDGRRRPRCSPPRPRLTACFLCAGQSCTAGERLLVHRAVRDEFVAQVAALVAERSSSATRSPTARRWGR